MTHSQPRRRVTYIIPTPPTAPRLKFPPPGVSRLGAMGPAIILPDDGSASASANSASGNLADSETGSVQTQKPYRNPSLIGSRYFTKQRWVGSQSTSESGSGGTGIPPSPVETGQLIARVDLTEGNPFVSLTPQVDLNILHSVHLSPSATRLFQRRCTAI